MKRTRPGSKYGALWAELDGLELYETWFVSLQRFPNVNLRAVMGYARASRGLTIRALSVPGGILFVRTA